MAKIIFRAKARKKRHFRGRGKVVGTPQRPRVSVFRSEKNIAAQLIDDVAGNTLVAASTLTKDFKSAEKARPMDDARRVGNILAEKAKAKKIDKVVFDKSGYKYLGRVKALAEGAREGGLTF